MNVHIREVHNSKGTNPEREIRNTKNRLRRQNKGVSTNVKEKRIRKTDTLIYECDICEKRFTTTHALKNHILGLHDRVKAHKCRVCDASFVGKPEMNRHFKVIHTDIKRRVTIG